MQFRMHFKNKTISFLFNKLKILIVEKTVVRMFVRIVVMTVVWLVMKMVMRIMV